MKFALAGNPNCGKTTLFNSLTGATAHVGNWPGVTVDKREGVYKKLGEKVQIVDLPGIYSLSPYTPEEVVSRNFILDEKPDCVINVVDATNLERNLYLTTQILEIDVPVIIALNMMDAVESRGDKIKVEDLEKTLGVPVVEISALKNKNTAKLMEKAYETAKKPRKGFTALSESELSPLVEKTASALEKEGVLSPLFHAVKLIESDEIEVAAHPEANKITSDMKATFPEDEFEGDFEAMVADRRYKYISSHFGKTVIRNKKGEKLTKSDKIDRVMTHRVWGIPIFLAIMFVVFHLVFSEDLLFLNGIFGLEIENETWVNILTGMGYEGEALAGIPSPGVWLQSWMGFVTGSIIDLFGLFMPEGTWYTGLVCDGILTGLDAVCSFLPQVLLLFLFMSIMEDSGYMARIAFIMDRAFRKFGLSGKAFIPLLMGFGCSVPAMMAAKTLEDERERDMTIRLAPFFSCGAKAPIWSMLALVGVIAGSFWGDIFVFSIYLLGIVMAIVCALIMKLFSGNYEVPPFIMELPSYHAPQFKNLMAHLWEKLKHYVYKAATIITASIVVIWFLQNFGFEDGSFGMVEIENSILAAIGTVLKYVFYPLGFTQGENGWMYAVASLTGLVAKEDVVATMAVLLGTGEAEEEIALAITLSAPALYSFAAYNLFTVPCMAAVATAHGESTKKGFWVTLAWWLLASYVISAIIYWVGMLYTVSLVGGILVTVAVIAAVVACGCVIANRRNKASASA